MLLQNKTIQIAVFVLLSIICLMQWFSTPLALIFGFAISQLFGNPIQKGQSKLVKILLQIAVVGLGFGMNYKAVVEVGKDGIELTIISITLTMILGLILGKIFKLDKKLSHLISSGTAICGGSAIAAVSPVIKANSQQISVALAVVFLLNSIALILFPPLGRWIGLTQDEFGLWSAIAIHDTSSVVGAAMAYGEEALDVATTVKLSRALWIIPVSFISMWMFKGGENKVKVPLFILFFIVAIALNSIINIPNIISDIIGFSSRSILVWTIFLVGAGINIKMLKEVGYKPISLGVALWIIISVTSLGIIMYFN